MYCWNPRGVFAWVKHPRVAFAKHFGILEDGKIYLGWVWFSTQGLSSVLGLNRGILLGACTQLTSAEHDHLPDVLSSALETLQTESEWTVISSLGPILLSSKTSEGFHVTHNAESVPWWFLGQPPCQLFFWSGVRVTLPWAWTLFPLPSGRS